MDPGPARARAFLPGPARVAAPRRRRAVNTRHPLAQRREVPKIERVISRPSTVPAERSADLNALDLTTCSTMLGSALGARGALAGAEGRAGGADGAGAGWAALASAASLAWSSSKAESRLVAVAYFPPNVEAAMIPLTVASSDGAISDWGAIIRVQATG